ncbi:MAG: NusG domain II-containing protein [Lachnospiraceae bacterium]|jgi:hypothetical protein|nr:NusG domain II-containing protein [Lachnospiraceae bacterium]
MKSNKTNIKYDIIFFVVAGIILVFLFLAYFFLTRSNGYTCEIKKDNKIYGEYKLDKDQHIDIKENGNLVNVVVIKDHEVYMKEADCPDKLCEKMGKISHVGETIVCLPNKIIITIKGDKGSDSLDSMTK